MAEVGWIGWDVEGMVGNGRDEKGVCVCGGERGVEGWKGRLEKDWAEESWVSMGLAGRACT